MPLIKDLNEVRMENGLVQSYAWPGGYPLYYIVAECGVLCPKCVNENLGLVQDPDDKQWHIIGYEINYEDDSLQCDNCYEMIPAAYTDTE